MNELTPQVHQQGGELAPFGQIRGAGLPTAVNQGSVAIEQERAIAEARGQMQLAKMFPRDTTAAFTELMESCKMPAMAAVAFYSVPRAGGKVTGPSIRLAEEIARVYGNFEYGHRELSRGAGKSEVEIYAWDKEKNNRRIRQITVEHIIDTRDGPKKMRDSKEVDDKIANVASKQVRGLVLSMMPKWMVEAAVEECKKTLAGTNDQPLSVRVRAMTQAFAKFGVTAEHLERYLGHNLDAVLADELVDLTGVYNSIKEGTPASEFFSEKEDAAAATNATAEAIKATAAKAQTQAAAPQKDKAEPQAAAKSATTKRSAGNSQAEAAAPASSAQPESTGAKGVEQPVTPPPAAEKAETQPPAASSEDDVDVF